MTTDITVPTLGESVTEATVAKWFKSPGESVVMDEPLVELETDKVTLEVNAAATEELAEIAVEAGADVAVGALLGRIDPDGVATAAAATDSAPEPAHEPAPDPAAPAHEKRSPAPRPRSIA